MIVELIICLSSIYLFFLSLLFPLCLCFCSGVAVFDIYIDDGDDYDDNVAGDDGDVGCVWCILFTACSVSLAQGGFFNKDGNYYCTNDYQTLFGTKCAVCGSYVEGEVVTALGHTYHQKCFVCARCRLAFSSFWGVDDNI